MKHLNFTIPDDMDKRYVLLSHKGYTHPQLHTLGIEMAEAIEEEKEIENNKLKEVSNVK